MPYGMPRISPKFVRPLPAARTPRPMKVMGRRLSSAAGVAIAGVGMAMMFGRGQAMVQGGGDDRAALSIAEQRLEQVRAAGFGSPTLPDPREETAADGMQINN